ncbi:MAG: hypothetical protein LW806_11660 [Planctomycetaceae bacterium]|nr:hypothetical protein [Planctomycetaceae bacterium]
MNRIAATITLALPPILLASAVHANNGLSIRDLAPETAILVLGADDVRGMIDRLGPTALGRAWADPAVAQEVGEMKKAFSEVVNESATAAGIDPATVSWPSSFGLAVMAEMDEELGIPSPQYVFFCDWTAEAENASKMLEAYVANIEKQAKDAGDEVSTEEIRGRRVLVLKEKAAEGGDGMGEDGMGEGESEDGMDEFGGMGMLPDFGPTETCIVHEGGRVFAASSVATMDTLLGRVDGAREKSFGDSAVFNGAMEVAGGKGDIYAVLATENVKPILGAFPQFMIVEPLVQRFFGDIKAWSAALHLKDGVIEQNIGIYVPDGKVGLLSLVDAPSEPSAPPSIVPSDALSYGRMNVRFDKVVPMLDEVIASLPPDQGDMIKPQLDMYRPAMSAAFAALGPEIHLWSIEGGDDPLNQGGTVTAIAMKNDKESAAAVSDFMNLIPLGLQSRDFNGMTIMSDEFSPVAVGIGGGYMVIGETKNVEQALRSVDAKGERGLGADEGFTASMAALGKDPVVGMAWWDMARQLELMGRTMAAMTEQVNNAAGLGEDFLPGLDIGMDEIGGIPNLLKKEVAERCFGDAILDFTSTKAGFMTRYRAMPPAAK